MTAKLGIDHIRCSFIDKIRLEKLEETIFRSDSLPKIGEKIISQDDHARRVWLIVSKLYDIDRSSVVYFVEKMDNWEDESI